MNRFIGGSSLVCKNEAVAREVKVQVQKKRQDKLLRKKKSDESPFGFGRMDFFCSSHAFYDAESFDVLSRSIIVAPPPTP